MPLVTGCYGIFPSDIVLRTAILAAIADLRSESGKWAQDYIWVALAQDDLTKAQYGDHEIARAKEWFQNTDIKVFMAGQIDNIVTPSVYISMVDQTEVENTVADVSSDPYVQEPFVMDPMPAPEPIAISSKFDGYYTVATGNVLMPVAIGDAVTAFPGMFLVNDQGQSYEILDIIDQYNILIAPDITPNLHNVVIKTAAPSYILRLESARFRETYRLGCLVDSDPVHLIYLHGLMSFILLRYRQQYFEARGFERMTISSSDFRKDSSLSPEAAYMRFITVTGFVTQSWPKLYDIKIVGVIPNLTAGTILQNSSQEDVTATIWSDD